MDCDGDLRNVSDPPGAPAFNKKATFVKKDGGTIESFATDATTSLSKVATSHMLSNPELLRTGPIVHTVSREPDVDDRPGGVSCYTLPSDWHLYATWNPKKTEILAGEQVKAVQRQFKHQNRNCEDDDDDDVDGLH